MKVLKITVRDFRGRPPNTGQEHAMAWLTVQGVVLDESDTMTYAEALALWNERHPDYPGDSAEDCAFETSP